MILNLPHFISTEKPLWRELTTALEKLKGNPWQKMPLAETQRFHWLYQRASADLGKLQTFASEPETLRYLETLVAQAYAEIHQTRKKASLQIQIRRWLFRTFPRTFQKHVRAFQFALLITIIGAGFGAFSLAVNPQSKAAIMPFPGLLQSPQKRVKEAEKKDANGDPLKGKKATFSSALMTNNIHVSIMALALGMTWGIGTLIVLFYNGVSLGAVLFDYIHGHETLFVFGWLLPHGVIEIPAILIAGQAGFIIAGALIGWGERTPLTARLRAISSDVLTLAIGFSVMLVWAGIVESFLSQYTQPILPYWLKIAFGCVELGLLCFWLGRKIPKEKSAQKTGRKRAA